MISAFVYTVLANFITSYVCYYYDHLRTIDDPVYIQHIHTCSLEKHSQGTFEKAERGVKNMDDIWFVAEGKAGQIIPSSLEFYLMIYKECKLGDNHRRYT